MNTKTKEFRKKGVRAGVVASIIVLSLLAYFTLPRPILEQDNDDGTWHIIWKGSLAEAAENDPGAGATGFLEIFFINVSATPSQTYTQNDSSVYESWCTAYMPGKTPYASTDNFNVEIEHNKAFTILGRFRFNRTHAHNGTIFRDADCRVNITTTGAIVINDVTGTNVVSHNVSTENYIWINVYWDNGGAGYTINKDQSFDVTEISIEAKF